MKLGLQSYCLRNTRSNEEVADRVRELGLDELELCAIHVDFQDSASFPGIVDLYNRMGVRISSSGVNLITGNEASDRHLFEFAKLAGHRAISVTFPIPGTAIPVGEKLAEEYGIDLAVHNHGGRDWLGSPKALGWLMKNTSDRIGLNLDFAWMLDAGFDPLDQLKQLADHIKIIHLKDFVFDRAERFEDVVVGTGNVDLGKLDALLSEVGFDGTAVLEYEGNPENPMPDLKRCVEKIKAEMSFWSWS